MRTLFWVLLAASVSQFAGCSEFVSTTERKTSAGSIDVVGEPNDPTSDSKKQADILGSAPPLPDDDDLVTDSNVTRGTPKPAPDDLPDPMETEADLDVAGGLAKPVSLKTKTSE